MAIATNIPQRLKTAFVVQGHIVKLCYLIYHSRRMPCNVLSENYVIKAWLFHAKTTCNVKLDMNKLLVMYFK